jgi:sulfur carrier protein ThiS
LRTGVAAGVSTETIRVAVTLHAELERHAPEAVRGKLALELPAGSSVRDLLRHFGLPAKRRVIVGVNGQSAPEDTLLRDGDRLDLVTPMTGG